MLLRMPEISKVQTHFKTSCTSKQRQSVGCLKSFAFVSPLYYADRLSAAHMSYLSIYVQNGARHIHSKTAISFIFPLHPVPRGGCNQLPRTNCTIEHPYLPPSHTPHLHLEGESLNAPQRNLNFHEERYSI